MTQIIDVHGLPHVSLPRDTPSARRCYGAYYVGRLRSWLMPAYPPFLDFVLHDLVITGIVPEEEAEELRAALQPPNLEEFPFITTPLEHQRHSWEFALKNPSAALFLSCGLGKSKVVVDYLRYLREYPLFDSDTSIKSLILAPKAVIHKWVDEFNKHAGEGVFDVVVVDGTAKKKRSLLAEQHNVYIASHRSLISPDIYNAYAEMAFRQVIIDESHCLKAPTSKTTKAAISLSDDVPRKLLLSGTPMLGNPMHLYGQLRFLSKNLVEKNSFWFNQKFIVSVKRGRMRIPVGVKNLDILRRRVETVAIEYSASTDINLPPLRVLDIEYTPAKPQLKEYNRLLTLYPEELAEALSTTQDAVFAIRVVKIQQILSGFQIQSNRDPKICDDCEFMRGCIEAGIRPYTKKCPKVPKSPEDTLLRYKQNPKMEALLNLVDSICVTGDKVIIWARFRQEINDLRQEMSDRKLGHVVVDGTVSAANMAAANKTFNDDPECLVYIGQISCGIGIDLIAAAYTIYYSLDFDLGHYEQSIKRFHRIGQTRPVTAYRMIAKNTIEEYIARVLDQKKDVSQSVTSRLPCAFCTEKFSCMERGTQLFDDACVHSRTVQKQKAALTVINDPEKE